MFRFHARELDRYKTLAEAATVVALRRRRTRSEAAKQEAALLTNKRRTKFPRNQVQEVRRLATNLTVGKLEVGKVRSRKAGCRKKLDVKS